jgi:hypothetical protein
MDPKNKKWMLIAFPLLIAVVVTIIASSTDNSKISSSLDGAIVTDKAGESYMLQVDKIGSSYKAYKFDTAKMKMVR